MDLNLGRLGMGILEEFAQAVIGHKPVSELRDSIRHKETVAKVLKSTEERFVNEFADKEVAKAIALGIPVTDATTLKTAFNNYYEHPTNEDLPIALSGLFSESLVPIFSQTRVDKAVNFYVSILTEELAAIDEKFTSRIRGLAELKAQQRPKYTDHLAELIKKIDSLSRNESTLSENSIIDSLKNIEELLLQIQNSPSTSTKISLSTNHIFGSPAGESIKKDLCFVLMPFGPAWSRKLFENHIQKACKSRKLKALRADDIYGARGIMRDVWIYINQAKLIIADLTTRNPNVFYEVGIAHTLGKEVILITQTMDDVPFDLRAIRCVLYSLELDGPQKLEKDLVRTISSILE